MNEKLKQQRIAKGMTQQEAADYCGVSIKTYNHTENKKTIPRMSVALLIAEKFGLTVTDLIEQDENETKLQSLRVAKGLTQREAAKLCNVTLKTYNRIETGKVQPRKRTLQQIADGLGVEVEEVREGV